MLNCFHRFNPRTPCGVRQQFDKVRKSAKVFQSTHSLRSATFMKGRSGLPTLFQSTHSLRSATPRTTKRNTKTIVSIHALLAECDPVYGGGKVVHVVSIHALLAECDRCGRRTFSGLLCFNPRTPCGVRLHGCNGMTRRPLFQSTHSLRSATFFVHRYYLTPAVSIHALLAECDCFSVQDKRQDAGFNPRTPCGVRRNRLYTLLLNRANHTLRQPP